MSDDDQPADPWRTPAVSNPDPRQNRIDLSTDDSCDPGWRRTRRILDSSARDECAAATPKGRLLELPTWAGNEFIAQDGTRPIIRTFTPRRFDVEVLALHSGYWKTPKADPAPDCTLHLTAASTGSPACLCQRLQRHLKRGGSRQPPVRGVLIFQAPWRDQRS